DRRRVRSTQPQVAGEAKAAPRRTASPCVRLQRGHSARMRDFTSMHPEPAEKQFYLKDFRHRAILFHVEDARQFERHASHLLVELKENPTLVILVARRFPRKRRLRPLRLSRRDFERSSRPGSASASSSSSTSAAA